MNQGLDKSLDRFMRLTQKSKVAVIVPLYGYWKDIQDNPVNADVLHLILQRLYSNIHQLYVVFVADPNSLEKPVADILISKSRGGNTVNVPVKRDDTYVRYIQEGLVAALETQAEYVIVLNPWVLIQDGAIDTMVDRVNYGDDAKIISGYNIIDLLRKEGNEDFDSYQPMTPYEERDLSFDFLGMPRYVAEMLEFDDAYFTHKYLERDLWQRMYQKGFEVIASNRVPIFPFEFPWNEYEDDGSLATDEQHFVSKWRFSPGITKPV